jgi:thiol-disulfide isomerase/thioredoxin
MVYLGMAKSAKNNSKGKSNTVKNIKKSKNKSAATKKHDNMDVKTVSQVDKLVENIKNNVLTLMLVYADWCGHCKTFKNDIWNKLASLKGRKISMAQVNEKVLSHLKERIPGLNVDGFPTVTLAGNDMKTSPPIKNTRDLGSMQTLVTADPNQVMAANGMSSAEGSKGASPKAANKNAKDIEIDHNVVPSSATPKPESAQALKEAGKEAVDNLHNGVSNISPEMSSTVPNPPNIEEDIVSAQTAESEMADTASTDTASTDKAKVGGSLFASLVAATRSMAPAVALATAGAAVSRRLKTHRKGTKKLRPRRLK